MAFLSDRGNISGECDRVAFAQSLGIADKGLPTPQVHALVQSHPDPGFAAHSFELCRDHPRIVEDQHIARTKTFRQIANLPVLEAALSRSEERRVGKECVRTCRSRWSPYH